MTSAEPAEAVSAQPGFLTGRLKMATRTATPNATAQPPVIRAERYRVRFDSPMQAALCARIAGACRYVWNYMLADCEWRYVLWQDYKSGPSHPSPSSPWASGLRSCATIPTMRG